MYFCINDDSAPEHAAQADNSDFFSKENIHKNWTNSDWKGWHSPEYNKAKADKNSKFVRDDKWLRTNILSKLDCSRTSIKISEIEENFHNSEWWFDNFGSVCKIIDGMYIKKGVDPFSSIYATWLTRLVQFINTKRMEYAIAEKYGLKLDENSHNTLHSGMATEQDCQPDFTAPDGSRIEAKLCKDRNSIEMYLTDLREDFDRQKRNAFHGAETAIFITKEEHPSTLFEIKLDSPDSAVWNDRHTTQIDLNLIKTNYGKISDKKDWPALPYSLLFGLTPSWQH